MPRPSADPNRIHIARISSAKNEPHVAVELEHAFTVPVRTLGRLGPTASDRRGAGRRFVVNGDARQPGRVQLFALLRERNIPFVVHSCDPITEREIAQCPM